MNRQGAAVALIALSAVLSVAAPGCRRAGVAEAHRAAFARLPAAAGVVATIDAAAVVDRAFRELNRLLGGGGDDAVTRRDLGDVLQRRLGIDPLALRTVTVFAVGDDVGLLAAGDVPFEPPAEAAATHEGVPIARLEGGVRVAALDEGVVAGDEGAVRAAIDVARGKAPALAGSPAGERHAALLAELPDGADVVVTVAGALVEQLNAARPDLGLEGAAYALGFDSGGRVLVRASEAGRRAMLGKVEEARQLARMGLTAARANLDRLDLGSALGVVYADHHFDDLARLLTPVERGDCLVLELDDPVGASSVLTVGVLAAVAIPAFLKYMRRARAAEGLE